MRARSVLVALPGILFWGLATTVPGASQEPAATSESLQLSEPVHHVAAVAVREPMVVEHPDGPLFVAGYTQAQEESGRPPKLFRSDDGGDTWARVDVGTPEDGAVGNSDVDLAVAPDGTLYFLTMGFDRTTGEGTHVAVGVSRDVGRTWAWTYLTRKRLADRPWIAVAPDGATHVIWNDGDGVHHAVSTDAGRSWEQRERIHPRGGSSHLAVGPSGQLAVRISPVAASGNRYHEGVDLLAVSIDGGATWTKRDAPGERTWGASPFGPGALPRWVEPVAWDADGNLFSFWSQGSELWLGRSADDGESWESWPIVRHDDVLFFPYLVARGAGELAATWFSLLDGDLRVNVARIDAAGSEPRVSRAEPFAPDSWSRISETPQRDPAGEYLPVVFLADGDLGLVVPIQRSPEHGQGFTWYRVSEEPD